MPPFLFLHISNLLVIHKKCEWKEEHLTNLRFIVHSSSKEHLKFFRQSVGVITVPLPNSGSTPISQGPNEYRFFSSSLHRISIHHSFSCKIYLNMHYMASKVVQKIENEENFSENWSQERLLVSFTGFPTARQRRKFGGRNGWKRLECILTSMKWAYSSRNNNI